MLNFFLTFFSCRMELSKMVYGMCIIRSTWYVMMYILKQWQHIMLFLLLCWLFKFFCFCVKFIHNNSPLLAWHSLCLENLRKTVNIIAFLVYSWLIAHHKSPDRRNAKQTDKTSIQKRVDQCCFCIQTLSNMSVLSLLCKAENGNCYPIPWGHR